MDPTRCSFCFDDSCDEGIYILISSPEFANRLEKTYSNDLSNSGTRVRQTFMSWGTSQLDFTYGKNRIGKTKKRTNRD